LGKTTLRLVTADEPSSVIWVNSVAIAVTPGQRYTTAGALRFGWSGDPDPGAPPESRPQVYVAIRYLDADGAEVGSKSADVFRYFEEDGTDGFETIVVQYTPPPGAASAKIEVGAARTGLPAKMKVDVDYLR
jgi:hypothetical protein